MRGWIVSVVFFGVTAGIVSAEGFKREEPKEKIQSAAVNEASGLAVSTRDENFLWIVNDSGSKPILHLVGIDGSDRGQVAVEGAKNVDWEDLSSFKLDGISYLLIADSGDNSSTRTDCKFYIVEEPALPKDGGRLDGRVKPAWVIPFSFEDGPRDCESAAVAAAVGKIILVSKRTKPPVVYEMPLRPKSGERVIAKRIGETSVNPPKGAPPLPFMAQPTGLAISGDGSQAAIVTYYGVFVFPRNGKESWGEAFEKPAILLEPHGMAQAESVAFSNGGKTLTVVSERGDARIVRYLRR